MVNVFLSCKCVFKPRIIKNEKRDAMPYDKKSNERTKRYVKEHQHRIEIKYPVKEYESRIKPAIESTGLPTASFIKQAISEKIDRLKTREM